MRLLFILFYLCINWTLQGQTQEKCNREARFKSLALKLPDNFCMPQGYWVTQIIDTVDLNRDQIDDCVIRWRKKKISEGDTVMITLSLSSGSQAHEKMMTFDNLYTPIFSDYTKEYETGNAQLDSTYTKYIYSNYNLVQFEDNTITVGFFTDAGGGMDFYFEYKEGLNDWVLTKKIFWEYPSKIEGKKHTLEAANVENISIRKFRIIEFLE